MTNNHTVRADSICYVPKDDGWTFKGYIAPVENLNPEVRFTYRPCIPEERSTVISLLDGKDADVQDQQIAKVLAARIKTWDVKDEDGKAAPISSEFIRRLQFQLFDRMAGIIIYGNRISDTDPEWKEEEKDAKSDAKFNAILTGTPVTEEEVEADAKN